MKRIKRILYITIFALALIINPVCPVSTMLDIGSEQAYADTPAISVKHQTALKKIKSERTEAGSIVSEHINEMRNGFTTVKMLEIPENQLSDIIEQWSQLGHEINADTIHNNEFIKYLLCNADIRLFSYSAKVPMLYFLVKQEIAEPIIYGGKLKKFFKTITFRGWFRIADAVDTQGNYKKGYEHLGTQKEMIVGLFKAVLSRIAKGSYSIVELYTDENGERKGRLKFFETPEQANPTIVQPIDAMAAYVLTYLNLVQENPGDIGVKKDLTKPIVERLITKQKTVSQDKVASSRYINRPKTSS
ncbi:MAG: hypothetical protein MAG551_00222 [Candidatus Scalindua arabica]|uniref:Uncharacterized protein n=1 Tax=Candidatus Scalindua arabica TaxID=1127984 RepID=A0A941W253_9BACT|nr:hypothetical protein [Candidatus Scalindua arabica]